MMLQLLSRVGDTVKHVSFSLAHQYVPRPRHIYPATVIMVILEIKTNVFTCLPSNEGRDSFPRHLDLTLAPNKTNEGVMVRSNGAAHCHLLSRIQTMCTDFHWCIGR